MSTVEREEVKMIHRMKAEHAEEILSENNNSSLQLDTKMPADSQMHSQLAKSIQQLKHRMERVKYRSMATRTKQNLNHALEITRENIAKKKKERMKGNVQYIHFYVVKTHFVSNLFLLKTRCLNERLLFRLQHRGASANHVQYYFVTGGDYV